MSDDSQPGDRIGAQVRRHRLALGLTQEELASATGLSIRAIADIESGRTTRPYRRSVLLLAQALRLSGNDRARLVSAARATRVPDAAADDDHEPLTPRQLPAAVSCFTGRVAELEALTQVSRQAAESAGIVPVSVIVGAAGVGKTALAVHWCHQVADRYPDGQLFINLRGFDPSGQPSTASEALRTLLEALEVPAQRIPADLDARAALYRSMLAGRRMLVLLDNARDAAQVRPLLPGSAGHLVVVTSRSQLTGLIASQGAHQLDLEVLTEADAAELLRRRLAAGRTAGPAALAELVSLCARLPLAISIATARAIARRDPTVSELIAELRQARHRLDKLDAGDGSTSVRAVLSWSYQALSDRAARMFRLLGGCPGPDVSIRAAACLAGVSVEEAAAALAELADTHLVARQAGGRHAFHDLLRAYAMELSSAGEALAEREAALRRLLRWYLHSATAAAKVINPARRHVALPAPETEPMAFTSYDAGLAWLDTERASLIASVTLAAELGEHELTWKLPLTLWDMFSLRGLFDDWIAAHRTALASAELCDEPVGLAWLHNNLGAAYMLLDDFEAARQCYEQILPLRGVMNDKRIEASLFHNLGLLAAKTGKFAVATSELGTALALYRQDGDRNGEGQTLNTIADTLCLIGRSAEALDFYEKAVEAFVQTGNQFGESVALTDRGLALLDCGDAGQAIECCTRALTLSREVGHLPGQARAAQVLGDALAGSGRQDEARDYRLLAIAIYDQLGDPRAARIRTQLTPVASLSRLALHSSSPPGELAEASGRADAGRETQMVRCSSHRHRRAGGVSAVITSLRFFHGDIRMPGTC